MSCLFFFFNDTATTEIYTLSLHDALPISIAVGRLLIGRGFPGTSVSSLLFGSWILRGGSCATREHAKKSRKDRKSTRLNSSHGYISYAVFCLKKKKA